MKNKILSFLAIAALGFTMASCDDFLSTQSTSQANDETFLDSDEAVASTTAPLYNYVWNSFNDKAYYSFGDGMSNNITAIYSKYIYEYTNFTATALSEGLEESWGAFYSVVAQSNNVINRIENFAGANVSEAARTKGIAEARFMRGLAYWYLGSLWGRAIIYTNTSAMTNNTVVPANSREDVIEFAIRDMQYAAANLPKTSSDPGRVTCYAAYGMLSRFYLSMAGLTTQGAYDGSNVATDHNRGTRNEYYLDLARKAALKCIEGPYALMSNYADLFAVPTWNNNSESIFQLQWMAGSTSSIGWGCNNALSAFFAWSTMVGEVNWGGATTASYDLIRTYDPQDKIRRKATITFPGDYYPELNTKNGGYTIGETETSVQYEKYSWIKKHVVGLLSDNGQSYQQSSGVNTYMMRLPEVYFNLVEATMGNSDRTNDAVALQYFNQVRARAGMPAKRSITYDDLMYERRIELAFEGQYWYDLLRRSYYYEQETVNYLNDQERNASYTWNEEAKTYEKKADGTGVSTATVANLILPISDVDRGRNPLLGGETVAYEFGEADVTASQLF